MSPCLFAVVDYVKLDVASRWFGIRGKSASSMLGVGSTYLLECLMLLRADRRARLSLLSSSFHLIIEDWPRINGNPSSTHDITRTHASEPTVANSPGLSHTT